MNKLIAALRAEGYDGQVNDAFMRYTTTLGLTGAFNDRLQKMLKLYPDLTGTVSDLLSNWNGLLPRNMTDFNVAVSSYIQYSTP